MTTPQYLSKLDHYINGAWVQPTSGKGQDVVNPATNQPIAKLGYASKADLDAAIKAAREGLQGLAQGLGRSSAPRSCARPPIWCAPRADAIADRADLGAGQGVSAEAKIEMMGSADIIDWFAEEGRRAYGRIIPARADGVRNMVIMEPVGPVAGFSPWNFPVHAGGAQDRGALAAGCSIIIKCPEETPGSPIAMLKCFDRCRRAGRRRQSRLRRAGGDLGISRSRRRSIRKISFTGSVPVGKQLAALAGLHMKRATMELGGHAPVLVFDDADTDDVGQPHALA